MPNLSYGTDSQLLECRFYSSPAEWMLLRHLGEWMYRYMDYFRKKNRSSRTDTQSKRKKKKKKEWGDPGNEYADLGDEKNGDALRAE